MIFYSFDNFTKDVKSLAKQIKSEFSPDAILGVARGGLTLAHSLSVALENKNCFSLNSVHYEDTKKLDTIDITNIPNLTKFNKILVVDDIIDSGESMVEIKRQILDLYPNLDIRVATIYYKKQALMIPEFKVAEASDWVEFFWDIKLD